MAYIWQRDLPDILRSEPKLRDRVIVWPGFDDRGRPPELFSFAPSGHISHHTGCGARFNNHDPASCVNFIIAGNSATGVPGPISQYLGTLVKPGTKWSGSNFDPHVVCIAAGRANHAGDGVYPWGAPPGNGSSIAGEWCGPFERWPDDYVEFRALVLSTILKGKGWPLDRDITHQAYALPVDGRKVDPSGAWLRQPSLGLTTPWSVLSWHTYVEGFLTPPPVPRPPVPSLEDPMFITKRDDGETLVGNCAVAHVVTPRDNAVVRAYRLAGVPLYDFETGVVVTSMDQVTPTDTPLALGRLD